MRKYLITGLIIILFITGCSKEVDSSQIVMRNGLMYLTNKKKPFTGTITEGYNTMEVKKGKLHGEFYEYYNNGELERKSQYKNGLLDGTIEMYFPGNYKMAQFEYKNGKMDGDFITYYQNNSIWYYAKYKENKEVGEHYYNHENGNLRLRIVLKKDRTPELIEVYDEDKNLQYKRETKKDKVQVRRWIDGKIDFKRNYAGNGGWNDFIKYYDSDYGINSEYDDFKHLIEYANDKLPSDIDRYNKGQLIGENFTYYDNGNVKEKRTVNKDNSFFIQEYNKDNNLIEEYTLNEKEKIDGIKKYYENDVLTKTESYKNGERHGKSCSYYPNGQIEYETEYDDGYSVSDSTKAYDEAGNIIESELSDYEIRRILY